MEVHKRIQDMTKKELFERLKLNRVSMEQLLKQKQLTHDTYKSVVDEGYAVLGELYMRNEKKGNFPKSDERYTMPWYNMKSKLIKVLENAK